MSRISVLWSSRKLRALTGFAAGIVALWIGISLWREFTIRREYARYEAEQRRITAEMNQVRVWPEYRAPELADAAARLRTVCSSEAVGLSGRFRYQLRIQPASALLSLLEPAAPGLPEVRGDESDLSSTGPQAQREWNTFRRRRDEEVHRLQRQLGIPTPPVLAIEFLDENGFKVYEILIPRDSLIEEREGPSSVLVAERQQQTACGSEVLGFHSWRLRPLSPRV